MRTFRSHGDRWLSNKAQAQRTAKHLSDFIQENLHHLRKGDRSKMLENAAADFAKQIERKEDLTPRQLAYLESIYERTLLGAGFPAIAPKHDVRRRALRFG